MYAIRSYYAWQYAGLEQDFLALFPQLMLFAQDWLEGKSERGTGG